jgi:hypothetical protein
MRLAYARNPLPIRFVMRSAVVKYVSRCGVIADLTSEICETTNIQALWLQNKHVTYSHNSYSHTSISACVSTYNHTLHSHLPKWPTVTNGLAVTHEERVVKSQHHLPIAGDAGVAICMSDVQIRIS